jgi:Tol biopolymer transport system component
MADKKVILILFFVVATSSLVFGLMFLREPSSSDETVPHEERWGIYTLTLDTGEVELLFSSALKIDGLRLNSEGDVFAFYQEVPDASSECVTEGSPINLCEEICLVCVDGSDFERLTWNEFFDVYLAWSPNGSKIAFLTMRSTTLDIYVMDSDGGNVRMLYDSGFHDGDIDWVGEKIVFTRNSQIWIMNDDGTEAVQVTDPPLAGEWGDAVLPFGDYDPRLSPDGTKIVFERLENDESTHGNYNIYVLNVDGTGETALTSTGFTQGFATWSHGGDRIAYLVGATGETGVYDIYMMNADGTDNRNVTPSYFPANFLCHTPIFSNDDSKIYFIGEWYS